MASTFEISEVRLLEEEKYLVVVRLSEGRVSAVFEVSLGARRKRQGWKTELKHHKKTFEMLHDEARESISIFCQKLSASLKSSGPAQHST
ncbi:MAG: hypothetical protein ABSA41_06165 [Terriglobia bacterium]|jgi:hypothetical protein